MGRSYYSRHHRKHHPHVIVSRANCEIDNRGLLMTSVTSTDNVYYACKWLHTLYKYFILCLPLARILSKFRKFMLSAICQQYIFKV